MVSEIKRFTNFFKNLKKKRGDNHEYDYTNSNDSQTQNLNINLENNFDDMNISPSQGAYRAGDDSENSAYQQFGKTLNETFERLQNAEESQLRRQEELNKDSEKNWKEYAEEREKEDLRKERAEFAQERWKQRKESAREKTKDAAMSAFAKVGKGGRSTFGKVSGMFSRDRSSTQDKGSSNVFLFLMIVGSINYLLDFYIALGTFALTIFIDIITLVMFNSQKEKLPRFSPWILFILEVGVPLIAQKFPAISGNVPYLFLKLPFWGLFALVFFMTDFFTTGFSEKSIASKLVFFFWIIVGISFLVPYADSMHDGQLFQSYRQKALISNYVSEGVDNVKYAYEEVDFFSRFRCSYRTWMAEMMGGNVPECRGFGPNANVTVEGEKLLDKPVMINLNEGRKFHLFVSVEDDEAASFDGAFSSHMTASNYLNKDVSVDFSCGIENADEYGRTIYGDVRIAGTQDDQLTIERGETYLQRMLRCTFDEWPDTIGKKKVFFEAHAKGLTTSSSRSFLITSKKEFDSTLSQFGNPRDAVLERYGKFREGYSLDIHSENENLVLLPKLDWEVSRNEDALFVLGIAKDTRIPFKLSVVNNVDRGVTDEKVKEGYIDEIRNIEINVPSGMRLDPANCGYTLDYLDSEKQRVRTYAVAQEMSSSKIESDVTGNIRAMAANQYSLDPCELVVDSVDGLIGPSLVSKFIGVSASYDYTVRDEVVVRIEPRKGWLSQTELKSFPLPNPERRDWRLGSYSSSHKGVNVFADSGRSVITMSSGVVEVIASGYNSQTQESVWANHDPYYGNIVKIKHKDGSSITYGHLGSVSINQGQTVSPGNRIGTVGTSGKNTPSEPHVFVQFENSDGEVKNPSSSLEYLGKNY